MSLRGVTSYIVICDDTFMCYIYTLCSSIRGKWYLLKRFHSLLANVAKPFLPVENLDFT